MTNHLTETLQINMARFAAAAIGMIALFLAILFRRAAGVILPLVIVILSLLCTLSSMAIFDTPLHVPTQILPSFLLAVGIGSSVHILVIFYQRRQRGETKEDSIAFAFGHSGLAILMTSLTTAGGLLSFTAAEMAPIYDLGVFAPIGVMISLLFTIVLLPALIAIWPMRDELPRENESEESLTRKVVTGMGALATRHPVVVVACVGTVLAVSLIGAAKIRFGHDPIRWFPEDNYYRQSSELVNEELGGALFLELLIDTRVRERPPLARCTESNR